MKRWMKKRSAMKVGENGGGWKQTLLETREEHYQEEILCRESQLVATLAAEMEPRCQQNHQLVTRGWAPSSTRWNRETNDCCALKSFCEACLYNYEAGERGRWG